MIIYKSRSFINWIPFKAELAFETDRSSFFLSTHFLTFIRFFSHRIPCKQCSRTESINNKGNLFFFFWHLYPIFLRFSLFSFALNSKRKTLSEISDSPVLTLPKTNSTVSPIINTSIDLVLSTSR
jgi:hypothetical protein